MEFVDEIISDLVPKVRLMGANHYIIDMKNYEYFQSYDTIIGIRTPRNQIFLDKDSWNTTAKYRCKWLGENKPETLKKIESGEYYLDDLNK